MPLFAELKRRKVFKVAAAYVIVAWLIMQVGEVMAPAMHLPGWVVSALAFFLILGFPVAIVLSWAFEVTPEGIKLETSADADNPSAQMSRRHLELAIIGVLLIAVIVFAFDKFVLAPDRAAEHIDTATESPAEESVTEPDPDAKPSIAVLAFEDMSPQQDQAYLSDGIAEELLNALAQISDLRVISRSSSFAYKGKEINLPTIAEELNVAYILEGSVRKDGNRVRITAQLIDAGDDAHVWSETYDRKLDDIFAVQEDVARRVVSSLQATLSPQVDERMSSRPTRNLDAYALYLKGREARLRVTEESNREAVALFSEAIELDPDFALAWAGLAETYAQRDGRFGYPQGSTVGTAIEHARRALAIDPRLNEAHSSLGYAFRRQGNMDEALRAYSTAIELNPNYYSAWMGLSAIHMYEGRYDESLWAAERASGLAPGESRPHYLVAHNYKYLGFDDRAIQSAERALDKVSAGDPGSELVGALLLPPQIATYQGDHERAIALTEDMLETAPDDTYAWVGAAGIAYMARDYERAAEWAGESQRREPGNVLGYWHHSEVLLGVSLLNMGQQAAADTILNRVIAANTRRVEQGERDWGTEWDLATVYAVRGETEQAMEWLQRAYEAGFHFMRWLPADPAFDGLRDHPTYRSVMERMQAANDRMRERVVAADPGLRAR